MAKTEKKQVSDTPMFNDHMVNLHLVAQFQNKMHFLRRDAVRFINHYAESNVVTLSTGEKAVDMDDAWLIIHRNGAIWDKGSPFLRDKREQRIKDKNPDYILPEPSDSDRIITWDVQRIIALAAQITRMNDERYQK